MCLSEADAVVVPGLALHVTEGTEVWESFRERNDPEAAKRRLAEGAQSA